MTSNNKNSFVMYNQEGQTYDECIFKEYPSEYNPLLIVIALVMVAAALMTAYEIIKKWPYVSYNDVVPTFAYLTINILATVILIGSVAASLTYLYNLI